MDGKREGWSRNREEETGMARERGIVDESEIDQGRNKGEEIG